MPTPPLSLTHVYTAAHPSPLVDVLAALTPLSKSTIKRALVFGGGWVQPAGKKGFKRCRKAKYSVQPGDTLAFYFQESLLLEPTPQPLVIVDTPDFGIWYKPANQVAQGSRFGDYNSLEACVQRLRGAPVHTVNRLDREARGLMVLAYHPAAAKALSQLWQQGPLEKTYQALVLGCPSPSEGHWHSPLDGKTAHTQYRVVNPLANGTSQVLIQLHTGRYHQIRRHFAQAGHPLMGDPAYGEGNSHPQGLQLAAVRLAFTNPCTAVAHAILAQLPAEFCLF